MTNPPDHDERWDQLHLDERWNQLLEAVRVEFWRWSQDPDAVFEPRQDELKLRARVDRPGQDAEWLAVTLTSHEVLNGDLATYAAEFVGLYQREREGPTNSTKGHMITRGPERRSSAERRIMPRVLGKRDRRSGRERRSGTDRRSGMTPRVDVGRTEEGQGK